MKKLLTLTLACTLVSTPIFAEQTAQQKSAEKKEKIVRATGAFCSSIGSWGMLGLSTDLAFWILAALVVPRNEPLRQHLHQVAPPAYFTLLSLIAGTFDGLKSAGTILLEKQQVDGTTKETTA